MTRQKDVMSWLLEETHPAARYLASRDLVATRVSKNDLAALKERVPEWRPLKRILDRQKEDGSFKSTEKKPTALPTFAALELMDKCGLDRNDEQVAKAHDYLAENHIVDGAISYIRGGSGVLPCYVGKITHPLVHMGFVDSDIVKGAVDWILDYQRFDHKKTRAGGEKKWRFKAVNHYGGCWFSVSCYHGVVGTLRALAAIPPRKRSNDVKSRIDDAVQYLRIHRGYKKSKEDKPLTRFLMEFFLYGSYRPHLIDTLDGLANADRGLLKETWVKEALEAVDSLTTTGRVPLVKNYPTKLVDPLPLERVGRPSKLLTHQWLVVKKGFGLREQ
jgi:hypothetical protein